MADDDDVPRPAMDASSAAQHHMTQAMNSLRMALELEGYVATGGVFVTSLDVEGFGEVVTALSFPVGAWDEVAELADKAAEIFREQDGDHGS